MVEIGRADVRRAGVFHMAGEETQRGKNFCFEVVSRWDRSTGDGCALNSGRGPLGGFPDWNRRIPGTSTP